MEENVQNLSSKYARNHYYKCISTAVSGRNCYQLNAQTSAFYELRPEMPSQVPVTQATSRNTSVLLPNSYSPNVFIRLNVP